MQVKTAANETSAKHESVVTGDTQALPSTTTKKITAIVDLPFEWNTKETVTP